MGFISQMKYPTTSLPIINVFRTGERSNETNIAKK